MPEDTSRCLECASELPALARFCPQCGARIAEVAPAVAARSELPPGERRQVAILFADLSGYTRLSSALDPEETHRLLTRFFELADAAIARMGGTIDKHIGDAVMGVFGAPLAYGNDVERALRAAVDIHAAMSTLSEEFGRPLRTHVGIASGEVVAAETGSVAHRSYTVTGDAVNLAARLTELATGGETVISAEVQRAIGSVAHTEARSPVAIRGLADDLRTFKLLELCGPTRVRQPLIGRASERERFADVLARARSTGRGTVALLCADPGMGKTRLAEALVADARETGIACHCATVLDFGAGQGRDAVHALVCGLLGVAAGDPPAARRFALDRAVAQARVDAEDEPYLANLLMIAQRPGSVYEAMDNASRHEGKLVALSRIVGGEAKAGACVLLVEDVHWASEWVQECLRAVARTAREHPVVLAMTTRRDGDPISASWPPETIVRFDLEPLAREDALALAREYVESSPDLAERCVDRAQGNPLFLMQLLRSGSDDDAVPASIQSVVLARLDRLSSSDKRAMQAAAVVGQRFPLELLRHLLGDPAYTPTEPVERDLVRAGQTDGESMMFTHALIRDGAYASLLHSARRAIHREAARWYATRDPTLHAVHLDRAEDARAADAYLAAARAEAAALRVEAALTLAARGQQLDGPARTRYALAALEGELQLGLGRAAASMAAFERARDAAVDDAQRCAAWIGIASGHRLTSDVGAGLAALAEAEPLAARAGLTRESSRVHYLRGNLHFVDGDVAACHAQHERALLLAQQAGDREAEAQALSGLADALYAEGRMKSAHAAFVRCVEICEREGLTRFAIANRCMIALIDIYFGELESAIAVFDSARKTARELHHRAAEAMIEETKGYALIMCGRIDDARGALDRALTLSREIGARRFEAITACNLARVYLHQGAHEEARAQAEAAQRLSEQVGLSFAAPVSQALLALTARTDAERRRALAHGESLLEKGCIAHSHFGFYADAIEVALGARDWAEAERYAGALETFARHEPTPWSECHVARARELARAGRGRGDRTALEACRRRAIELGYLGAVPALDAALAAADHAL